MNQAVLPLVFRQDMLLADCRIEGFHGNPARELHPDFMQGAAIEVLRVGLQLTIGQHLRRFQASRHPRSREICQAFLVVRVIAMCTHDGTTARGHTMRRNKTIVFAMTPRPRVQDPVPCFPQLSDLPAGGSVGRNLIQAFRQTAVLVDLHPTQTSGICRQQACLPLVQKNRAVNLTYPRTTFSSLST